MTAQDPPTVDPYADLDSIEMHTVLWRRFLDIAPTETIELTYFDDRKKPVVAYVRTAEDHVRLLQEADARQGVTGIYTLVNRIHEGLFARIGEGRWTPFASRASDNDATDVRAVYIDVDADRPRDISSTDAEKYAAYCVYRAVEDLLTERLGVPLGRGDSGNGHALFIPLEPIAPSKDTTARIARFLKAVATRFNVPGVKIDPTVYNPARLCPAFGTRKRKGIDTPERPHRLTSFSCPGDVRRIPIGAL